MNAAEIVARKIYSKVSETFWTFNTETDSHIMQERLEQIERAMAHILSVDDAWKMALACAALWMPSPSRSPFEYNSVEYNTVEIFCLCTRNAYKE